MSRPALRGMRPGGEPQPDARRPLSARKYCEVVHGGRFTGWKPRPRGAPTIFTRWRTGGRVEAGDGSRRLGWRWWTLPGRVAGRSREWPAASHAVWWQWTIWPRLVMSEIAKTARSSLFAAPGHGLADGPLGPLTAYLHAPEARVAALEARLSAGPLLTPADASQYARVAVKTILRAVRGGELARSWPCSVALRGDLTRCSRRLACQQITRLRSRFLASPASVAVGRQAKRSRRRGESSADAVDIEGRETRSGKVSWRVRWRPGGAGGPRESRTFDREADAKAFAADIRLRARLGHLAGIDSGKVTLDSYVSDTWVPVCAPQLAENTRRSYRGLYVSHIAPFLGECALRDLTRQAIARWQADRLRRGAGPSGVVKALVLLGSILETACEAEHIATNPVRAVRC